MMESQREAYIKLNSSTPFHTMSSAGPFRRRGRRRLRCMLLNNRPLPEVGSGFLLFPNLDEKMNIASHDWFNLVAD